MSTGSNGSGEETDDSETKLKNYMEISCGIAWTLLGLCGLGVASNTVSIIIYAHPTMKRVPINVLLTGLSVIDLCLSFLSIPAFVIPGLYASNTNDQLLELLMGYSSVYIYPLTSMTYTASVWTFVIISWERWHAICGGGVGGSTVALSASHHSLARRKRWRSSAYALATVCVVSFLYNFVRFFEFRLVFQLEDEDGGVNDTQPLDPTLRLSVVAVLRNSTTYPVYMNVYHVGLFLVTHFTAPFVALVVLNGLTLRAVYVARQRRRRLLTRRERKEHRTVMMMVSVVVIFVVCYSLVFTLNIIEAVDDEWFYREDNKTTSFALNDISNLLVVLNSATTAFIYFIFNRRYRELCMTLMAKWLACCWCCCWETRNRYCERDQLQNRGRSAHLDGCEMSDAVATPCLITNTDDGQRNVRLLSSRKDVSPPLSSTGSSFFRRDNNNHADKI